MVESIPRSTLGLAAEYAVAAELCRRGTYAQLTLGNQKRTDLLVFSESGGLARLEVKAKQGRDWPNCRGICGPNAFLVFVDYQHRASTERPDFYILSSQDWRDVLEKKVIEIKAAKPKKNIVINDKNIAVFMDEIRSNGRPYEGMGIRSMDIIDHREKWEKIAEAISDDGPSRGPDGG
ncbi:MAG: hypothetical protein RBU45_08395 [Myxococcota bacterium]|jgi:hypothetical protein|nr:hypothetical protein [Myxococcota bacterium]